MKRALPTLSFVVAVLVMSSSSAVAQLTPTGFEKVLLPIAFTGSVSGAFGSLWTTDFWVYADSDSPAVFADTTGCNLFPGYPPGKPCEPTWSVPPHSQNHGDFQGGLPGDPPGLLLY